MLLQFCFVRGTQLPLGVVGPSIILRRTNSDSCAQDPRFTPRSITLAVTGVAYII